MDYYYQLYLLKIPLLKILKTEKPRNSHYKIQVIFVCFVLQCIQRENVNNFKQEIDRLIDRYRYIDRLIDK